MACTENDLRACDYAWRERLAAEIERALAETGAEDSRADAVAAAWRRTRRENPVLFGVLDAEEGDQAVLTTAHRAEARMLALYSGMATPDEPEAEIVKVGLAFLALARSGPEPREHGRVSGLLRRLVPSG
jgi:hypothetical protein